MTGRGRPGRRRRALQWLAVLVLMAAASGAQAAASSAPAPAPPAASAAASDDPWQSGNRKRYAAHEAVDRKVIRPAALAYERRVPKPVRDGVHNALSNLGEPVVFANDVLQLRPRQAAISAWRFVLNSTVGLAGLFDVAARSGAVGHANDFGVTLGRYGVRPGPYVFVPMVGPSTVRDSLGSLVDGLVNPFSWARYEMRSTIGVTRSVVGGLDTRARADTDLQAIDNTATDPYATLRSLYLQNRQSLIRGEAAAPELPDFDATPEPPAQISPQSAEPPGAPEPQTPQGCTAKLTPKSCAESASPQGAAATDPQRSD